MKRRIQSKVSITKQLLLDMLLVFSLLTVTTPALALDAGALPTGGQITAGSGAINQSGSLMTIEQNSQRMIANWSTFNIGADAAVNFNQPNSSAVALNRIQDQSPSQIRGALTANGQIYLLNPSGIIFGQTAQIDVGGLVASSLTLSDDDFLAGNSMLSTTGTTGAILNHGNIRTADGGYVAFIAPKVENSGTIDAPNGTVVLTAGNQVNLDFNGDRLLTYTVEQGAIDALVENHGLIKADGGLVMMTAAAADQLTGAVVNNDGVIQAQTLENRDGRILLLADMDKGTTNVAGILDASAPNGGDGGFIETSAAQVNVDDNSRITTLASAGQTGEWLIDPATDYTVAASGGDITGATLSGQLATTNVELMNTAGATAGSGDVNVNDAVSWSADTTLTLTAANDVNVNADIEATGNSAGLNINQTGTFNLATDAVITLSGSSPSLSIAGNAYTVINDANALQNMNSDLAGHYALGSDVDASATSGWNTLAGFDPVGGTTTPFTGQLNGLNHSIGNLTINRPGENEVGLFGRTDHSSISNVGLLGGSIAGNQYVGSLIGYSGYGSISNSYATGDVSGVDYTGGLVGYSSSDAITNSYATATVTGSSRYTGGLVGNSVYGSIRNSYATGGISGGSNYTGGLAGYNRSSISNSYATGDVSGDSSTGGLLGANGGNVRNVYATGNVSGNNYVGGLVGYNYYSGNIDNAYATGGVTGTSNVGGVVGYSSYYTTSTRVADGYRKYYTYSCGWFSTCTGSYWVDTSYYIYNDYSGRVNNTYWDTQTSGMATGVGGGKVTSGNGATGLNTTQMMQSASFPFDFFSTWRIYNGNSYPVLRSLQQPLLTVTANNDSKTYDGLAYGGGNGVTYSVAGASLAGTPSYDGTSQGATDAGSYNITPQVELTQMDYQNWVDVTFNDGTLDVNQAALSVTSSNDSKTYDGLAYSGGNGVAYSGFVTNEDETDLGGTLAYGGTSQGATDAGSYAITPGGLTSGNYDITYNDGTLDVNQAALSVTSSNDSKTYDGLAYSGGNGVAYSGFVTNEDEADLGGTLAYGGTSQGATDVASYAITPSGLTSGNYDITFSDGTLDVNQAALSVTSSNDSKTYDGLAYSGGNGVAYSGLVTNEDETDLGGTLAYGGTSQGATDVASYSITPSGLTSGNYDITFMDGELIIENNPSQINSVVASLMSPQDSINGTHQDPVESWHEGTALPFSLGPNDGSHTLDGIGAMSLVKMPACVDSLRGTVFCE